MQQERLDTIEGWLAATPHPELYQEWQQAWFAPSFWAAIEDGTPAALQAILTEVTPGVWAFDLFTDAFCDLIVAELDAYEASSFPKARPNSM